MGKFMKEGQFELILKFVSVVFFSRTILLWHEKRGILVDFLLFAQHSRFKLIRMRLVCPRCYLFSLFWYLACS